MFALRLASLHMPQEALTCPEQLASVDLSDSEFPWPLSGDHPSNFWLRAGQLRKGPTESGHVLLRCMLPGCWDFRFFPTHGFSANSPTKSWSNSERRFRHRVPGRRCGPSTPCQTQRTPSGPTPMTPGHPTTQRAAGFDGRQGQNPSAVAPVL